MEYKANPNIEDIEEEGELLPGLTECQLPYEESLKFILAGKAIFTIRNRETGNRFTFKVSKAKNNGDRKYKKQAWFVSVLTGPDNNVCYQFFGTIFKDEKEVLSYNVSSKSRGKTGKIAISKSAFAWFFRRLNSTEHSFPQNLEVFHAGRCGRCGRLLTVPESIKSGYGPECVGKVIGVLKKN